MVNLILVLGITAQFLDINWGVEFRNNLKPIKNDPTYNFTVQEIQSSHTGKQIYSYYPTRGNWWTLHGRPITVDHMLYHHMHNKKHGLSESYMRLLDFNEINSLHSDAHEGRIQRQYAR